jgi:uncharacterized hydrophobic protein (TIGR00271 family)
MVPIAKHAATFALLNAHEHAFAVNDFPGPVDVLIQFKCQPKQLSAILKPLDELGVGRTFGHLDIVTLQSTKPRLAEYVQAQRQGETRAERRKRRYNVGERMSVEEIRSSINGQSRLTFDYLVMVAAAALIAGVGIITDSSVTVVASMLVSPLMGPILAVTFGAITGDTKMLRRGLRNEGVGILLTIFIGIITGFAAAPFFGPGGFDFAEELHSEEMESRGTSSAFVGGFMTAVPSGIGVALGITGGGTNALVGVAISAALLPPIVNAAMCSTFSIWYNVFGFYNESGRFTRMGLFSFGLFVLNFITIFCVAYGVFKMKKLGQSALRDDAAASKLAVQDGTGGDDKDGHRA